jgi:hypothetical protein
MQTFQYSQTILIHCRGLSFTTYYSHVKAHQDNTASFEELSRKLQLNCICDHKAKTRIAADGIDGAVSGRMFPQEPIGLLIRGETMTSETRGQTQFWAHHQLAQLFHCKQNILSPNQ